MLHITTHAVERYAERIMGMNEIDSQTLSYKQFNMIRNMLKDKFRDVKVDKAIINYDQWDCRFVIVDRTLVTIITN